MVFARLVTHYWSHGCFLADGQILAGMARLVGIPVTMIHGRYDVSSPLDIRGPCTTPGQAADWSSWMTPAMAEVASPAS
jgi:hypothetical protein